MKAWLAGVLPEVVHLSYGGWGNLKNKGTPWLPFLGV